MTGAGPTGTPSQPIDVAAVVAHYRAHLQAHPVMTSAPEVTQARVDELVETVRAIVTQPAALRPAGEALVVAAHQTLQQLGGALFRPVLVQLLAGLELIDEAFAATTADMPEWRP